MTILSSRVVRLCSAVANFVGSTDFARGVGRGIRDVELGLRLRYEIRREFAPYIGINWTRKVGDTADIVRRQGGDVSQFAIVAGLRLWC